MLGGLWQGQGGGREVGLIEQEKKVSEGSTIEENGGWFVIEEEGRVWL